MHYLPPRPPCRQVYEELIDDHFKMSEQLRDGAGPHTRMAFKQGECRRLRQHCCSTSCPPASRCRLLGFGATLLSLATLLCSGTTAVCCRLD